MKAYICFLAILGCSLALPSPPLAWEELKGENVYMDPIRNYTQDVPVNERVIGGTEVVRNSIPYQVGIRIDGQSFCGGSLITRSFVVTAAHCTIRASFVQIILGAHNINSNEATQVRITSTHIINHPQYIASTLRNDVSLVRLPTAVVLNNQIQLITLAPASAGTFAGSTALLTGWGRISDNANGITPILRRVNVNIMTNSACANVFGSSVIVASTICTSGAGTVGACQGDSGGPLVFGNVQVGITSFVAGTGCQSGLPSGFARVSSFTNWIAQNSDL